jgi:hypothetical protein
MEPKKIFPECHVKSTKDLAIDVLEEYKIFYNLLDSNGFTGVDDNYKIRQMINKIIYEIRRMQDFLIKTNTKSKVANAITKKLKKKDCCEATSRPKDDVCCEATSRLKDDDCCKSNITTQSADDDNNELDLNPKSDEEDVEAKDI